MAAIIIGLAKLTAPDWSLAVAALLFSVLVFVSEIVDNLTIVQPRSVIAPALLLYAAMVAMLRPRGTADAARSPGEPGGQAASDTHARIRWSLPRPVVVAWSPVIVFALVLAVACGFNYRVTNNRSESPPWTGVVALPLRPA